MWGFEEFRRGLEGALVEAHKLLRLQEFGSSELSVESALAT